MKLVSMKLDPSSRAKMETLASSSAPEYPWGLSLTLDNETLAKLGIGLPEVGKTLMLHARVDVTGAELRERTGEGMHRSATLQIVALGLEADAGEGASEKLYGQG